MGLGPLDGHGVVDGVTEGVPDGMQELEDGVAEGVWEEGTGVEGLPGTRARAGLTQRAMTALRMIVEVFMVAQ